MRRRLTIGIVTGALALAGVFVPVAAWADEDPGSVITPQPGSTDGKATVVVPRSQINESVLPQDTKDSLMPESKDGFTPSAKAIDCLSIPNSEALCCEGFYAPSPVLDTSSPRRIHVGGRMQCNYVDSGLRFQITAYSVWGSGENTRRDWEDSFNHGPVVAQFTGRAFQEACIGTSTTRWQFSTGYTSGVLGSLIPYPLWTSVYTFACGAG